tara:strand:+ start:605 stop:1219 length:615 start_codon:yes stop_codon:yes gene_type:complete
VIIIIDYGVGNLRSISSKLDMIGIKNKVSSNENDIKESDKLILPGVGHFKRAIKNLKNSGLIPILENEVLVKKKPILGICLGMQLFFQSSEESKINGLGWINGKIKKFNFRNKDKSFRVPHMGWNTIQTTNHSPLINNIDKDAKFYFAHSYYLLSKDNLDIVATTSYEIKFTSIINKKNIFGTQFHPEKSHKSGLTLLSNFNQI